MLSFAYHQLQQKTEIFTVVPTKRDSDVIFVYNC